MQIQTLNSLNVAVESGILNEQTMNNTKMVICWLSQTARNERVSHQNLFKTSTQ